MDIFLRDSPLLLFAGTVPMAGLAFRASIFVIRPARPVPCIWVTPSPFSAIIFLAAGEAVPVA